MYPPIPETTAGPAPLPARPSVIIASVSGGNDSAAAALWARQQWPETPIIVWHAHLARMDWPETSALIDALTARLGQAERVGAGRL